MGSAEIVFFPISWSTIEQCSKVSSLQERHTHSEFDFLEKLCRMTKFSFVGDCDGVGPVPDFKGDGLADDLPKN